MSVKDDGGIIQIANRGCHRNKHGDEPHRVTMSRRGMKEDHLAIRFKEYKSKNLDLLPSNDPEV